MSFNNSSGFRFNGKPMFNNVHGNQVNNHTTITAAVVHMLGDDTPVTKCTISDEFETVKRGHIIGMKELGSVDLSEWDWYWQNGEVVWRQRKSAQKTISTVQVHPNQQSKFTAIIYEGEDAQKAWEDDFKQFSHASRTGFFQLFGINRSDIPMLIFHHELIPVAHFYTKTLWMNVYIEYLMDNKRCSREKLWMDTNTGVLCNGPNGPSFSSWRFHTDELVLQALPLSLDMLEEETSVAFFSKFGSNMDSGVLHCAWWFYEETYLDDLSKTTEDHQHEDNNHPQWTANYRYLQPLWRNPPHHLPINIIGGLRFDTVYSPSLDPVARWPPEAPGLWKWLDVDVDGFVEETQIDGGLMRFKYIGQGGEVPLEATFNQETFEKGWLSQSACVFDPLKTTGHQESFFVVNPPWPRLRSTRHEYKAYDGFSAFFDLCDVVEETRPIYFFLLPPPMTISEFISWVDGHTHFWSFDKDGRTRIPEEEWRQLSIPILTPDSDFYAGLRSWPTHIYPALRDWQIARGFDPSTADWARECGFPEFELVGAKKNDQFEEIPEQPEKSGWSWSRLWTAIPGSDISAFAC